jgi:hypothetical protein
MLHLHKWKTVIKGRASLTQIVWGHKESIHGLRILQVCEKCGNLRAWLVDSNGDGVEKLPESVFTDDELEEAKAVLSKDMDITEQMKNLPQGNFYNADRYDTADEHVLHLWKDGESYDIRVPKK